MTRFALIVSAIAPSIALLAACDRAAPLGRVSIGLSEDVCHDYCLVALRANLYREADDDLPLGPALQIGCGEALSFPALPAGERVRVTLQAYDITGELLLEGASEALTIVADGTVEARVPLVALAPPEVDVVAPDPVVAVDGPASVSIDGVFGPALGKAGVELGGQSYDGNELAWTSGDDGDTIALSVPVGAEGGPLVVRRCGIASKPTDLRVIGPTLGEAAVTAGPACAGANARAAALVGAGVLIAWGCADGSGSVSSMRLDDALCPLDPGASWTLPMAPDALAVVAATVWVGGPNGLVHIDLASAGSAPVSVPGGAVRALAATASEVFAILGDDRLVRVSPAVSDVGDVDPELTLTALVATADGAFVAAHNAAGDGRLISLPSGGVVAVYALAQGGLRCDAPLALAASNDARRVALACRDGGVGLWDTHALSFGWVATPGPLAALAFDDTSDVVFGAEVGGAGLALVDLEGRALLHRFARSARLAQGPELLTRLGAHRLLMPSATAPLAVLTPFDQAGPCLR